jgi:hypothetical protein
MIPKFRKGLEREMTLYGRIKLIPWGFSSQSHSNPGPLDSLSLSVSQPVLKGEEKIIRGLPRSGKTGLRFVYCNYSGPLLMLLR